MKNRYDKEYECHHNLYGSRKQATTDAQVLASLGIHSGICLPTDALLGDHVLDLITYNFYNTMPHAEIEPFSTLCRYYDGETYVNPKLQNSLIL